MKKPEIGQTVYRVGFGWRSKTQTPEPVTVTKVGRKYFTVGEGWGAMQFYLDDWLENAGEYSSSHRCYEDPKEWEEELEKEALEKELSRLFHIRSHLSLSALRKIKAIVDED